MSNEYGLGRRLLPGTGQMAGFPQGQAIAYQQPRETQKNYVFVDEHNRHKRLKVMRACEGCRRRKIKCDAATTNTWPCSACIRLKLHCVRPNGYDGALEPQVYEPPHPQFEPSHIQDGFRQQLPLHDQQLLANAGGPKPASMYAPQTSFADQSGMYHMQYSDPAAVPQNAHYTTMAPVNVEQPFQVQTSFPTPPMHQGARQDTPPESISQEPYGHLADLLGNLRVNEAGTAPYLNNKLRPRTPAEEEPAVEDDDYKSFLPPLACGPGLKIRIPPELMPDEVTIMQYFELYFSNTHPYVPVLDKVQFYQQWQTNPESISVLLLEAIFSIAGRLADEPSQGQQWLALATRHADSFMDVPRLSTLQALMIILKAREQAPKRGYYYRSWMSIVQCVQMAKDLGLDDHYADHQAGKPCGSTLSECRLKTRIWQSIFVCEVMIGSPQARTDLQVEIDSVDFSVPRQSPTDDECEYQVSRNFTYLARVVRNIARMNKTYSRLRRKEGWGISPEFTQILPEIEQWLIDLPADMSVNYPHGGSAPWLQSPFIGNIHTYHCLSVILYSRPQLALLDPSEHEGAWKQSMRVSYNAAKKLCRLQEAVLNQYDLPGLQCMQRGINFTIYAVLACIVLHLVALTSPDPELNSDAREYFTRHMRILERCVQAWPMEDMQKQIDSVRQAFSADTRKAFVLKPSFPYGSPHSATHSSPLLHPHSHHQVPLPAVRTGSIDHHHHHIDTRTVSYSNHPITPPISAGPVDIKTGSPGTQSSVSLMSSSQGTQPPSMQQTVPLTDAPSAWNPSRLFEQWNTSFGTPPVHGPSPSSSPSGVVTIPSHHSPHSVIPVSNIPPPSSSSSAGASSSLSFVPSSGAPEVPTVQDIQAVHAQLPPGAQQIPYSAAPVPTFVTPTMWRESVASVYEGGLKRAWDYDAGAGDMAMKGGR